VRRYAEAILELEKARRAAKRRMDEAEETARVRRVKEEALEARTTAMLLDRRAKAEVGASPLLLSHFLTLS
jgi:hypothetical protein